MSEKKECENIRKSLIYKTAVEYGDYTLNHVTGCSHGCKYPCYAYMMAKRFKKVSSYEEWLQPKLVDNIFPLLSKELPKYREKIRTLHLCFSTDPYMYGHPEICRASTQIIEKANVFGVHCSVLTKGILPIELANMPLENEYGITVVTLDENFRMEMEPGAAPMEERIRAGRSCLPGRRSNRWRSCCWTPRSFFRPSGTPACWPLHRSPVSWWSPPPHRGRLPSCALRAGVSCCSGTLR